MLITSVNLGTLPELKKMVVPYFEQKIREKHFSSREDNWKSQPLTLL